MHITPEVNTKMDGSENPQNACPIWSEPFVVDSLFRTGSMCYLRRITLIYVNIDVCIYIYMCIDINMWSHKYILFV